jgi:hypothetical protein
VQRSEEDIQALSLVTANGELALTYVAVRAGDPLALGSYRIRRFALNGSLINDTLFAAANPFQDRAQSAYPPVFTGNAYVNAALRMMPNGQDRASYLLRLCVLRSAIVSRRVARLTEAVTMAAETTGGVPGYSYAWDFGDRAPIEREAVVSHRYPYAGTYVVTLTVTDASGATFTTTTTVQIVKGKQRAVRH